MNPHHLRRSRRKIARVTESIVRDRIADLVESWMIEVFNLWQPEPGEGER